MKLLKSSLFVLMLTIFSVSAIDVVFEPMTVDAVFVDNINSGAAMEGGESANIIAKIFSFANVFAGIVLAISIVMIILGGLRYITANGDPKSAEQGKMVLLYSGIGVLIALSAFALGRFFQSFAVGGS